MNTSGDGREGGGAGAATAGQEAEAAARDGIAGAGIAQKQKKLTKMGTEVSQPAGVKDGSSGAPGRLT